MVERYACIMLPNNLDPVEVRTTEDRKQLADFMFQMEHNIHLSRNPWIFTGQSPSL